MCYNTGMVDRRAQILSAAQQLLEQQGFASLSVRAVAQAAGVGASTLRHYFPSQEDLQEAVLTQSLLGGLQDCRIAERELPAVDRLSECLEQFLPPNEDSLFLLEGLPAMYALAYGTRHASQSARGVRLMTRVSRERIEGWLDILGAERPLRYPKHAQAAAVLQALVLGLCLELLGEQPGLQLSEARAALRDAVERLILD